MAHMRFHYGVAPPNRDTEKPEFSYENIAAAKNTGNGLIRFVSSRYTMATPLTWRMLTTLCALWREVDQTEDGHS